MNICGLFREGYGNVGVVGQEAGKKIKPSKNIESGGINKISKADTK